MILRTYQIKFSEEEVKIICYALHAYAAPLDNLTVEEAGHDPVIVEDMACKFDIIEG